MVKRLPPVHPGEVLLKDFLEPLEITRYRLAKDLGVDPRRIHAIVEGQRAVTAETALMLAKYFGTSAKLWMGIQSPVRRGGRRRISAVVSAFPAWFWICWVKESASPIYQTHRR